MLDRRRYELIDGNLMEKKLASEPHVLGVMLLAEWAREVFGKRHVTQEAPFDVLPEDNPTSDPEPDIAAVSSVLH